jgi:2-dehydropantoate 2-reductase
VVGAGAVGSVFGGWLARSGVDVTFLARGATLAALRTAGLAIESPTGDVRLPPGHAAASPEEIGAVDAVLVAVKAGQVAELAPTLAPLVGAGTVVVPMQNGVEASERLAAALDDAHVAEGFCWVLAEQVAPGRVRHGGGVPTIALGVRTGAGNGLAPAARTTLDWLAGACRAAGLGVETPADATAALWEKLLFVEPLGVVGAAARVPFGEMMAVPETHALLEACAHEILGVARAAGVALTEASLGRAMDRWTRIPAGGTASMQRDIMDGRPSELEAQTGAVVRLGRTYGAPTPAHDALYAALRPQELRARGGTTSS